MDRIRAEKYQTLDDYSDSIERELEELRLKRGETRGLMVPQWDNEGHTTFWKEVDRKYDRAKAFDIDDVESVRREAWEKGKIWKAAAYNRKYFSMQGHPAPSSSQLLITSGLGGSGGGGLSLATAQQMEDIGPEEFIEASSSEILDEQPTTPIEVMETVQGDPGQEEEEKSRTKQKRKVKKVRREESEPPIGHEERETEFA